MEASLLVLLLIAIVLLGLAWKIAKKTIRILLFLGAIGLVIYIVQDYLTSM